MTANAERGEVEITLDGKAYPMRPSYEAMQAIERRIGNLIKVFRRLNEDGDGLSCAELAIIVTESVKAAGKDRDDKMLTGVTERRMSELIYEAGLIYVFEAVTPLVGNMLSGGAKPKKTDGETQ